MTDTLFTVRSSALSGYTDCPRRGAAKMFRSLIRDAGFKISDSRKQVSGAIGTGVHKGATRMLLTKRDHLPPVPVKELHEIGVLSYREETQGGVMFDKISMNHNAAEKQIGELIGIYQSSILPQIIPVDIETPLESAVNPSITVSGHPDVMSGSEIRDLKCGRTDTVYYAQMGGYSLLAQDNGRPRPNRLIIDWLPRKDPMPEVRVYDVELCERMAKSVLRQIAGQLNAFLKSGNPDEFPCNPMSVLCSPKYCAACGTKWCGIKGEKENE